MIKLIVNYKIRYYGNDCYADRAVILTFDSIEQVTNEEIENCLIGYSDIKPLIVITNIVQLKN